MSNMRIIAEIGSADGSLDYAIRAALAAQRAGAWAVKGQLYTRDKLVHPSALTYGQNLGEPETQWDNFERVLDAEQWSIVKTLCDNIDIKFFLSVFDEQSARDAAAMGCDTVKIASADITHRELIESCGFQFDHVIMSTGASTVDEIKRAVKWLGIYETKVTLLVCTLSYPTPIEEANLARIQTLRDELPSEWGIEVGYSDHTPTIATIAQAHNKWDVRTLEKHFTVTPGKGGDHDFAVNERNLRGCLKAMKSGTAVWPEADGSPELEPRQVELEARTQARRSLVATQPIRKGERVGLTNTTALRPATGLPPYMAFEKLSAVRNIKPGELITADMAT